MLSEYDRRVREIEARSGDADPIVLALLAIGAAIEDVAFAIRGTDGWSEPT